MKHFTQKTVQLLAVFCMVILTAFSAKADVFTIEPSNFSGSSYGDNNGDHTKDGIGYYSYQTMLGNSAIQMQSGKGYIYNTSNLGSISSIAFTYTGATPTVYEGTAENPTTTTVTGVDGVYTFSSDMGYFCIKAGSGTAYLSTITITYTNTAGLEAIILASTDEMAFSAIYTETDSQVLTLSGANLTSDATVSIEGEGFSTETTTLTAAEIMAGADIEVVFTAPEAAGEYTGTLSIASDDFETIEVALTGTSIDASIQYTMISDIADLTRGKYVITGTTDNAMTSTNAGTYFKSQGVSIYDNYIPSPDSNIVWDVVVTDGTITMQSTDTQMYVAYTSSATSSSNYSYAVDALYDNGATSWTVSMDDDGVVTLVNVYNTSRTLRFNSDRFAGYTSTTGTKLRFFKEPDATEPAISVNEELAMGKVVIGKTTTATVAISGDLLTSDVTVSIAGDEAFTATATTYSAEEVMAGVSYEVTFTAPEVVGDYTTTISISGDDFATVEVAVSASAIAPLTIADIYSMDDNETGSVATATVDYVYSSSAYISDANGTSILAYGLSGVTVGDVLTEVAFTVGSHGGLKQMASVSYASSVAGESTISPIEINLSDLMDTDGLSIYGGQLVIVKEVALDSTEFVSKTIVITQNGTSSKLYNSFNIDIENELPETANVTGYVTAYNSVPQIAPRAESDIVKVDSGETGVATATTTTTAVAGGNGAIVVKAAAATTATIYNTTGQVVAIVNVAAGESAVTLAQGLYLVSIDGAVTKAVVR